MRRHFLFAFDATALGVAAFPRHQLLVFLVKNRMKIIDRADFWMAWVLPAFPGRVRHHLHDLFIDYFRAVRKLNRVAVTLGHFAAVQTRYFGSLRQNSVGLGEKIEHGAVDANRRIEMLVQVDLAGEPTKHGAREDALAGIFDAASKWQFARLRGLMLLPPAVDDPGQARPYFRALTSVRDRLLARGVDEAMLTELSMGMSHDFEVAIEEGATLVRVGTAIFGRR